jgi:hypothetical protein
LTRREQTKFHDMKNLLFVMPTLLLLLELEQDLKLHVHIPDESVTGKLLWWIHSFIVSELFELKQGLFEAFHDCFIRFPRCSYCFIGTF